MEILLLCAFGSTLAVVLAICSPSPNIKEIPNRVVSLACLTPLLKTGIFWRKELRMSKRENDHAQNETKAREQTQSSS